MTVLSLVALCIGLLCIGFWIGWDVSAWWHERTRARALGRNIGVGGTD